eukprot:3546333-Karenia_brevis.AAC.1
MGWQTQWSNGSLMLKDQDGDAWKPNPDYGMGMVRSMFEQARINLLWAQASKHRHGSGMEHGLDLTVTNEYYN